MPANDTLTALAADWAAYQPPAVSTLSDSDLLDSSRVFAEMQRLLSARAAAVAGEIGYRSRKELGYDGLAQRHGARTPENLVQQLTGGTRREAHVLVQVGELLTTPAIPEWQAPIVRAVQAGELPLESAEAIRLPFADAALGASPVDERLLAEAVTELVGIARTLTTERLAGRARQVRDALDELGVADREQAMRDKRYLHLTPLSDGMTKLSGLLDPESAAQLTVAIDAATSPRRGGPRFVDPNEVARQKELIDDERSTEQIALDALVALVGIGMAGDSKHVVGSHAPTVRLLVTAADLDRRSGTANFEGQTASVSIRTVERHCCAEGLVPIMFDFVGQTVINVGRTQRLFTPRQREGLAARDGGCRFPGCDRPASWCEAHHINEWKRDHGNTDLADGILLCKHHHLLMHNNHWRVLRKGSEYFAVPPRSLDGEQKLIPMPPRSVVTARLVS